MHPIDPPLVPNPTTPHSVTSLLTQMYRSLKNPRNTFTSSPHLVGCTQRALQESLADNVVFANEGIVHAVFQPSKVDDQTVVGILAEIDHEKSLKAARDAALSVTVAKRMKNKSMLTLLEHITNYNQRDAPLMNKDYGRHILRAWLDTLGQSIRMDPEINLPEEIDTEDSDDDSDYDNDQEDNDDEDEDEGENESELAGIHIGMKRKATTMTPHAFPTKVAKTTAQCGPSTAALCVIDDHLPDLTLIDIPVGEDILQHPYGRHVCLFMELKVDASKKPNPQEVVTEKSDNQNKGAHQAAEGRPKVKSIVRQNADIARLHLAARPFMRYSLHITVCGTIFNICLFDRASGVISKDYDLKKGDDFETFVRIIRRATCDMDAYELGLDPTVTPLDYLGSVARYPRFKVEVGENAYHTYGFPIWQSRTRRECGTWVFGATKDDNPNPKACDRLVLKNAWRTSGRLLESRLYVTINKLQEGDNTPTLRCVAEFVDGGDVMIGEDVPLGTHATSSTIKGGGSNHQVAIRVSSPRRFVEGAESNPNNPTLHRVALATHGKSLVSYTSFIELLSAAESAAEGLHSLSQLGIDHRDVSIRGVRLGTDPEKAAGFISDLDLPSISEEAIKAACPNDYVIITEQMKDGEWRTGTALFMADELLTALVSIELPRRPTTLDFTFQHRLCHDFESLIWVVVCAMKFHQRNLLALTNPERFEFYNGVLNDFWQVHSYHNIQRSHDRMIAIGCAIYSLSIVRSWFPDPREVAFFRDAMRLIRNQTQDGEPITYEGLCALFRKHSNLAKEPQAFRDVPN